VWQNSEGMHVTHLLKWDSKQHVGMDADEWSHGRGMAFLIALIFLNDKEAS
jgi:hypothetical protein